MKIPLTIAAILDKEDMSTLLEIRDGIRRRLAQKEVELDHVERALQLRRATDVSNQETREGE